MVQKSRTLSPIVCLWFAAAPLLAGLLVVSGSLTAYAAEPDSPVACFPYLLEYIRIGRQNNPIEVLKLQLFLREFEGFTEVPVSGVYEAVTFEAVKKLQLRYSRDVLGPWGITEATGYVFITTRLAINNIYCGRSTVNNLDLRNFYARPPPPPAGPDGSVGAGGEVKEIEEIVVPEEEFGWLQVSLLILIIIVAAFLGIYWRPVQERLRRGRASAAEQPEEELAEELFIEEPEEESITEQPPLTK